MDDLRTAWLEAQHELPEGWRLEALRCAPSSLHPADRSDDWIAVAIGPEGEERTARGEDPMLALAALVADLRPV
jgi:hypothetical protein